MGLLFVVGASPRQHSKKLKGSKGDGMAKGWIKLYRQIQLNSLWKEKRKFSKVEAWIDILFLAKYADENEQVGYITVLVPRGSFLTTIRELCARWGWSNTKVCSFLAHLNLEKMLLEKATAKKTLLTVVNYDLYQGEDDELNDRKTTEKRQENDKKTLPSIKERSKEVKNIIPPIVPLKNKFLDFVYLAPAEHERLTKEFGEADTSRMIEILDNYIGQNPKKNNRYTDHNRAIRGWVKERLGEIKFKDNPDNRASPQVRQPRKSALEAIPDD
jgi:hypothetical protein